MVKIRSGLMVALLALLAACGGDSGANQPAEVIVYSARNEHLIKPLFDRFTEETGIAVRYVTDDAGPLLTRLQAEGENSPADLLMTVDAGNLWQAAEAGMLRPVQAPALEAEVPAHLRDPQGRWFALTIRARTMVYSTERVQPEALSTYEALADPAWRGRLCLRTAKKVYNQSLVATMIAALGAEQTEQIVRGWVDNLAVPPFANDTLVMEAIAAGQCDVGLVNTYYYGRLKRERPELPVAIFWPNQSGEGVAARGVHVNVSSAGVTRYSRNPEAAIRLLTWLAAPEAQRMLVALNQEYAVNAAVEMTPEMAAWGAFRGDDIHVGEAGRLQVEAVKLMDRAGYQ